MVPLSQQRGASQIPISQPFAASPIVPMSQPKKRPYHIDPKINKKVNFTVEEQESKRFKLENLSLDEVYLMFELLEESLVRRTINLSKSVFTIGRGGGCDATFDDDRLSKLHCVDMKTKDEVWLLDNSTNSCFINETSIGKGRKVQLKNGERLSLFQDGSSDELISFKVVFKDSKIEVDEDNIDAKQKNEESKPNNLDLKLETAKIEQHPVNSKSQNSADETDQMKDQSLKLETLREFTEEFLVKQKLQDDAKQVTEIKVLKQTPEEMSIVNLLLNSAISV